MNHGFGRWAAAMAVGLTMACGPQVGADDDAGSQAETAGSGTEAATGTPTPPGTTDTLPGTATEEPQDTGVLDSGPTTDDGGVPDLPEFCSIIDQDCPRGYKCMPFANDGGSTWNATKCVPIVEDPNAPGQPCSVEGNALSGIDDCDGTSMCWNVDEKTNMGACIEFCIGDIDDPVCPNSCDQCSISGSSSLLLCIPSCDPLAQDCGEGEACYPVQQGFVCAPDATRPGTMIGDACEFINVCPEGSACVGADVIPGCEGSGCCTPYCPLVGDDPCPALLPGTSCTPYYEEPPDEACVSAPPGVCADA
ncbi:MAG: hypothetical protein AAF799_04300 [Myxococcota bacterium]